MGTKEVKKDLSKVTMIKWRQRRKHCKRTISRSGWKNAKYMDLLIRSTKRRWSLRKYWWRFHFETHRQLPHGSVWTNFHYAWDSDARVLRKAIKRIHSNNNKAKRNR